MLSLPKYGNRAVLIDPPGNIDYGVTIEDLHSIETMLTRQAAKKFRIRYVSISGIDTWDGSDRNYLKLEAILQMCFDLGRVTLVIDEVDMFCSPYGIPETFKRLLARGRHDELNLIWTARRPQEVSKLLLSQTDEFFLFQMHHAADIDYFKSFMVFDPEVVRALQVGEHLHWTAGQDHSVRSTPAGGKGR